MKSTKTLIDVGLGENVKRFFSQYYCHLESKHWLKYRLSLSQRRQRALVIHLLIIAVPSLLIAFNHLYVLLAKQQLVSWGAWLYLLLVPVIALDIVLWRYSPLLVFRVRWQLFNWFESAAADRKRGTDEGDDFLTPKAYKHPEFCYWWQGSSFTIQVYQLHSLQLQAIEQLKDSLTYKLFPKGQMIATEPLQLNGSVVLRFEPAFKRKVVQEW